MRTLLACFLSLSLYAQSLTLTGNVTVTGKSTSSRVTLPAQPLTGYGSSQYSYGCTYSGIQNTSGTGNQALNFEVYGPTVLGGTTPKSSGIYLLWSHGFGNYPVDPWYHDLLQQTCRKGIGVIAASYQTSTTPTSQYITNAATVFAINGTGSAFAFIAANSGTYMPPISDGNGGWKTIAAGHSVGGWVTWGIINLSWLGGANLSQITVAAAFAPVDPVYTAGVTGTNYPSGTSIPNTALVASFVGWDDPLTYRNCMAATQWLNASSMNVANKPFFAVHGDQHGTPPGWANHYFWYSSWFTPAGYPPDISSNTGNPFYAVSTATNAYDFYSSFPYVEKGAMCVLNGSSSADCTAFKSSTMPWWIWTDGTPAVTPTFYNNTTSTTITTLQSTGAGGFGPC